MAPQKKKTSAKKKATKSGTTAKKSGKSRTARRAGRPAARKIRSVLIPNRGEIALRIVRTLRAMGIRSVVAHSEADAESDAVRLADDSVLLGPAAPSDSYLSVDRIVDAAQQAGVDAVHPGYGFLSERETLASTLEDNGLIFIGPSSANIRLMGDKIAARKALLGVGLDVVPGEKKPVEGVEALKHSASTIGYPLMLKAAAGGGGKGIRIVREEAQLESAFRLARSEAENAFNDPTLFVERYLEGARHVEVQIVGDGKGGARIFPERDCSTQRRHQKLLEETPCPALDDTQRERLLNMAFEAIRVSKYRGAGTLEFLLDPTQDSLYFLEMNTRLQVEHPITELVCGVDLVAEQIAVAEGKTFAGKTLDAVYTQARGAAVEFRVNAEDPFEDFRPCTGTVDFIRLPGGPGIRVDTALRNGLEVTPYYDSLLAKVIAWGPNRESALNRLRVACGEMRIRGVATTLPLALALLDEPAILAGRNHCQSLEERLADTDFLGTKADPELARALAVAAAYLQSEGSSPSARRAIISSTSGGDISPWARLGRSLGLKGIQR